MINEKTKTVPEIQNELEKLIKKMKECNIKHIEKEPVKKEYIGGLDKKYESFFDGQF